MTTGLIEWGVASIPLEAGESGDACRVDADADTARMVIADGLGHGPPAAAAARLTLDMLAGVAALDMPAALARCHERLKGTRGVVLMAGCLDARGRLTWLSVGNIQGVLRRGDRGAVSRPELLLGRPGVVGRNLGLPQAGVTAIAPGDLIVFATDGIHPEFADRLPTLDAPQRIADAVMAAHRTGTDDALVLAVRYRGGAP